MRWGVSISLSSLPTRREVTIGDKAFGIATVFLHILALITPASTSWIIFRRAIAFPIITLCYLWLIWVPKFPCAEDQWGMACLLLGFQMRLIDHISFVPEQHHYRLRAHPAKSRRVEREPIPDPWTMRKVQWATSLFGSWRGIGWSYASPLSTKAQSHPYRRTSTRGSFVLHQIPPLIMLLLIGWTTKVYMTTIASDFFQGRQEWANLTKLQVIGHSLAVVCRVWWILNKGYIPCAIGAVILGGLLGWTGEFWEPWGWPPIFGGFWEVWTHPGLSTIWSRTWNNGGRRWFYAVGWVGIGEKILHLPKSSTSTHSQSGTMSPTYPDPAIPASDQIAPDTPRASRDVTPSHPLPTSSNRLDFKTALSNLIKSTIAFTLSGLLHDIPAILLLLNREPALSFRISPVDIIYTTPFFAIQPMALAIEAIFKRSYRSLKRSRGIDRGNEPIRLVFIERLFGFVVVWSWLFWCAAWYVIGVARMGLYNWDPYS